MKKKKAFLIRDIEPDIWRDFKTACAHYDIPIRDTLLNYIQNIVDDFKAQKRGPLESTLIKSKKGKK